MNKKEAQAILEIWNINNKLTEYIKDNFVRSEGMRLRRGPVQKQIAEALGFTLNPSYYKKINAIMNECHVRLIKIDGVGFYGELDYKEIKNETI